ncbi:LOW QUALITY PROTEIN: olfactory receptor 5G29-like [Phaethornis superciliosus]
MRDLFLADQHRHMPVYFFLGNFFLQMKICSTSTLLPRLLASFLTRDRTIPSQGCMTQFFFFGAFAGTEGYLLATMSDDQDLAICQALLYTSLMKGKVCLQLVAGPWLAGLLMATIVTGHFSRLQFCGPNKINHFFWGFIPLLELACCDTRMLRVVTFLICVLDGVFLFVFTLRSSIHIIAAILRIPTPMGGRQKAFSPCSSHLIMVSVFYSTPIIVYMNPSGWKRALSISLSESPAQGRMKQMRLLKGFPSVASST